MASFTPVYDQPVTFAALSELDPEILTAEVTRLQNSIRHLERSNVELRAFCEDDEEELDEESKKELESSRQENEVTIATQRERLEMLRLALQSQLGVDAANSHYTLAGSALPAGPTTTNASDGAGVGAGGQASVVVNGGAGPEASGVADGTGDDVHEGMYL